MNEEEKELEASIADAVKLHGHLGPFLVIGVRMGLVAKRVLSPSSNRRNDALQAAVRVPLSTPFSCVLDGIQASTRCTVGNGRLKVEDSPQEIFAKFKVKGSGKTLTVFTNREIVQELEDSLSEGTSERDLAMRITSTAENRLFELKREQTSLNALGHRLHRNQDYCFECF